MLEFQPPRVEKHAPQSTLGEGPVPREVAVLVVAGERKTKMRQVHANLMGAPGMQLRFKQANRRIDVWPDALPMENGAGVLTLPAFDADASLSRGGDEFAQRQIDASPHIAKFAFHQNHVALVHLAFAQCCMKKNQRRAFFGDQQHARCIAIEAVHQFEELGLGPRRPKSLDQSERDTAAAVNRQSRWLVECDQYLVLENDVKRGKLGSASLDYGLRRRTYRRDAQFIAHRQSDVGSDSLAVEAHFPAAQHAINVALGNAFEQAKQEIIDALPGGGFVHCKAVDSILA